MKNERKENVLEAMNSKDQLKRHFVIEKAMTVRHSNTISLISNWKKLEFKFKFFSQKFTNDK